MKLLVIEDEDKLGEYLRGGLSQEGFEPVAALEQAQALRCSWRRSSWAAVMPTPRPASKRARQRRQERRCRGGPLSRYPPRSASYTARSQISTTVAARAERGGDGVECCRRAVRALAPGPCSGRMRT